MTVDDALKIIAQERLDALAEGMTAEEAADIAAYVLHDAVLKDRKYIALLLNQKFAIRDETIEDCASLVDEYNDTNETGDTLTMLAENMRSLKTEIL